MFSVVEPVPGPSRNIAKMGGKVVSASLPHSALLQSKSGPSPFVLPGYKGATTLVLWLWTLRKA